MTKLSAAQERLNAAIRLEPTGTVPVAPKIGYFSARFVGMTTHEWLFDKTKQWKAMLETFDRMGGWDFQPVLPSGPRTMSLALLMKVKLPGVELPPDAQAQALEEQLMTVEDYDIVIEQGYQSYTDAMTARLYPDLDRDQLAALRKESADDMKEWSALWESRGVPLLHYSSASGAFSRFAGTRSLKEFLIDLHRRPQKVKEAIAAATPEIIASAIARAKACGNPRVMIASSRESGSCISPKRFEEFGFPAMKQLVDALVEAGFNPVFHFDQDWTLNLPYLKQLPKKKCILQLDGFTDIFKAKEVLGDHMCIFGDLPPALLALGTPEEVTAYCKKLIDVVGEGGGFILSSGCNAPIDSKPENIQAMLDTARTYPHR